MKPLLDRGAASGLAFRRPGRTPVLHPATCLTQSSSANPGGAPRRRGWAGRFCRTVAALSVVATAHAQFVHPGALSTQSDLDRMAAKVTTGAQPWTGSWDKLVSNTNGWTNHNPEAVATITAGGGLPENYIRLARDAARAYQLALRFHGDGSTWAADKSVQIMNAWAATHTGWTGDTNVSLRAGLYGYQFACAAELMRDYSGWTPADLTAFKSYMLGVFYPRNEDFLTRHHGTVDGHYWANWTLANVASFMAIGVLCDDETIFDSGVDYFHNDAGTANIMNAVPYVHPNGLGQWQESGRDQGHSAMGPQLMGVICEIAWNQGLDLYGAQNNRFLASVEYISKYNLWKEVPFAPFVRTHGHPGSEQREVHWNISSTGRGTMRPGWDLVYHHYVNRMGMDAPYTADYAAANRPEGGGFNHGPNSGGFDGLGFTTLTHARDPIASGSAPSGLRTTQDDWQVTLSWWGSAKATSYNVKRGTSGGGPFTTIATVGTRNLFHVDAGLTAGTTYHYVVSANTPGGETADSDAVSVIAIAADGDSYQAEDATYGDGAVFDDWTTGHHGTGYVVPMTNGWIEFTGIDGGAGGPVTLGLRYALGSATRTGVLTVNGTPQSITADSTGDWDNWFERFVTLTLNSGTNNTIRIESDGSDNFVYIDELIVKNSTAAPTMAVPSAPGGLTASSAGASRIDLSWNAVAGADSYNVKRAKTSGGPYVILDNQTGTTFSDESLADSTTYHYVVTAINAAGESASSQISAATPTIPKFQESGGVVSMEAENGLLGSRWLAGTDSGASNGAYLEVDPAYDWGGSAPEGTTGEYLTSYGLRISSAGNHRFWFRMLSNNAVDDSFFWRIDGGSWSLENNRYGGWFSTDTFQLDSLSAGDHLLEVSYRENGARLDKFVVQLDSLAAPSGNGPVESQSADTTAPGAPGGLSATAGNGSIGLDWNDITEPDLASYTVYRSTTSGSGYSVIASGLTSSVYADNSATNGTTYYYVVTASDTSSNESASSVEASATPTAEVSVKASLLGATFPNQAGPTLATSPSFDMAGGNAVAVLVTAERSGSGDTISATFAGQPMTLGVSTSQGVQWAGVFHLIDPGTTSGAVVITTTGSSASFAYSAISLANVSGVADVDAVANTSTGGTISLATTTTTDGGYVLGAVTNNGWDASNPPPSFVSGDADQTLLAPVLIGSSGHLHTYGDLPEAGTSTNEYGNLIQRNAYVTLAFNSNVPDAISPTVNLTTSSGSVTGPFDVTVGFSESVSGLDLADFVVVNGSAETLSGSGADYTLNVSPATDGTVSVTLPGASAQDAAANGNLASNTLNVTYTAINPQTIQAESASYGAGAIVESNQAGFNGSGFINMPASGGYVEFSGIDGGSSGGMVILNIRYALGATQSRAGQLTVNGVSQSITATPTGSWSSWNTLNVGITLNSGSSNTIRIASNGNDWGNVDQITVAP